ncbi:hypothetical protein ACO0R3_001513 [Hanseniaspora guilliermondii]
MNNFQKGEFKEKCAIVQSLLPQIQIDVIERKLTENNYNVEVTVDQILSTSERYSHFNGNKTDATIFKSLDFLDIDEDFILEKTSYWLNLFPQLSHSQIKEVIKQNIDESDEIILSALEATSVLVHEESDGQNFQKNLADTRFINEIILFEHTPHVIVENDLLLGDLNGIDTDRIIQIKRDTIRNYIFLDDTTIEKLLEEHGFHIGRVLVYIITEGLSESFTKETFNHSFTTKAVVQRSQGKRNVKLADPFAPYLKKSISKPKKIIDINLKSKKLIEYCNDKTTEILLKKVINYYVGDEKKALHLLDLLEKNEYINESVKIVGIYQKHNEWSSIKFSEPDLKAQNGKSTVTAQVQKETIKRPKQIRYAATLRQKEKPQRKANDTYEAIEPVPLVVDLHGQTVAGSLMTISKSVRNWWRRELYLRGNNAVNLQDAKSHKALYTGQLKIITGKGLHSKNGISIIKIQCRNYLRLNFYTFEEHDGYFIVTGRQASRNK